MKCLIIGTSNSIMKKGYRPFLEEMCREHEFTRFCIGATPSTLIPYAIATRGVEDADVVLLDTMVNDASYSVSSENGIDLYSRAYTESVDHLLSMGKKVIMVLLPQLKHEEMARSIRDRRLIFAQGRGLPVMDGFEVLDAMHEDCGVPRELIMRDDKHFGPYAALIAAQRIAAIISDFGRAGEKDEASRVDEDEFLYAFKPFLAGPGIAEVERSTSLLSHRYIRLDEGDEAEVEFDHEVELSGISLNAAATSCFMTMGSGSESAMLDLRVIEDVDEGKPMQHMVAPIAVPVRGRRFVFSPVSENRGAAFQRAGRARSGRNGGYAEVAGVLARRVLSPSATPGAEPSATPGVEPSATPGAEVARQPRGPLSAAEKAIARLALIQPIVPEAHARKTSTLLKRMAGTAPIWEDHGARATARLIGLARHLGLPGLADAMLAEAVKTWPRAPVLRKLRGQ